MFVSIFKNWLDDVQAGTMFMKDFMKMEGMLMQENEDDMGKIKLLEVDDNIVKLQGFFLLFTSMMKRW